MSRYVKNRPWIWFIVIRTLENQETVEIEASHGTVYQDNSRVECIFPGTVIGDLFRKFHSLE
jgi:hypothetical protein